MRKIIALLLILMLSAGCGSYIGNKGPVTGNSYQVVDIEGNTLTLAKPPERIITMAMYTDNIVLGMLPSKYLVGISQRMDDPKNSAVVPLAKNIPFKVTDYPSAEEIIAQAPDIAIATEWTNKDLVQTLRGAGIPVFVCKYAKNVEDVKLAVRMVGQVLQKEEKAELMIGEMEKELAVIKEKVDKIPEGERKHLLLLGGMKGYGGTGTIFDDMCRLAGVKNSRAEVGVNKGNPLTKELILKANPDVIVLPNYDDHGTIDQTGDFMREYIDDPALQQIKAIKNREIKLPREYYTYNSSQDVVYGIRELAYMAYGDTFAQADNRHISFSGEK